MLQQVCIFCILMLFKLLDTVTQCLTHFPRSSLLPYLPDAFKPDDVGGRVERTHHVLEEPPRGLESIQ